MPHPITEYAPDVDTLLNYSNAELGYILLKLFLTSRKHTALHLNNLQIELFDTHNAAYSDRSKKYEVGQAISEAWGWLESNGLLISSVDQNASSGFRDLSRLALSITSDDDFYNFQTSNLYPKELLHPKLNTSVWAAFMRSEYDTAVFQAFKAVEESVRHIGNFSNDDIGVQLMRKAFNPDSGPLTNSEQEKGEREALMHLFAGAIGSYKNPHSHRTVIIENPKEAIEMIMLASHLLGIVDSRINE